MGAKDQGANETEGRWLVIPRTLSFVFHGEDVLLMKRAAHKRIFPNRYNGLGGHIERDEDVWNSARREIEEESGLKVHQLRLRGIHQVDAGVMTGILLFIFTAQSDTRDVADSAEGTLEWVHPDELPTLDLVEDVAEVLSKLRATSEDAPPWYAHVRYDAGDQVVLRYADPAQANDD